MKALSFTLIVSSFLISSCCTKKKCLGNIYKEVTIVYKGYSGAELRAIRVSEYDKQTDSLVWPNKISYTTLIEDSILRLGQEYVAHPDSFYLDQRYFAIILPGHTDTIKNISYRHSHHTMNCNHCPGDNQLLTDVLNFSYEYNGVTHHEGDTVFVVK